MSWPDAVVIVAFLACMAFAVWVWERQSKDR